MLYRQYCESGIYKIDKVKTILPNKIMIFSEYQNKIRQLQNTRTPYCYQIKMVVNGKTYVKVISHIGLYPFLYLQFTNVVVTRVLKGSCMFLPYRVRALKRMPLITPYPPTTPITTMFKEIILVRKGIIG